MKKIAMLMTVAFLFPVSVVLARDGGGSGSGFSGSGGRSGGFGGGGFRGGGGRTGGFGGGGFRGGRSRVGGFSGGNKGFSNFQRGGFHSFSGSVNRRNGGYGRNQDQNFNKAYGNFSRSNRNNHAFNYNWNRSTTFHQFNRSTSSRNYFPNRDFSTDRPSGSFLPRNLRHSSAQMPARGPNGQHLSASLLSPRQMNAGFVRKQMNSITGNRNFRSQINGFNRDAQNNPNHYYWHNYGGQNFCNYYDGNGCNWYGWYVGGSCFWTQYYCGLFWWNDPWYGNWDYWDNGCWNWQNPENNTVYIYENGQYDPSNGGGGTNYQTPDNGNGPQANYNNESSGSQNEGQTTDSFVPSNAGEPGAFNYAPQTSKNQTQVDRAGTIAFRSDDDSCTVKLMGESHDAFLYDTAKNSAKPVYLDTGVTGVRFTGSGKGIKVQLTLQNGKLETFKADGKPLKDITAGLPVSFNCVYPGYPV